MQKYYLFNSNCQKIEFLEQWKLKEQKTYLRGHREERGLNSQKIRKIFDNYHQEEPRSFI